MAAMSDYLENELLDHIFNVGSWSAPANRYLALLQSASADDDTPAADAGKEIVTPGTGGYARQSITTGSAAAGGTISNTNQLTFGPATSNWPAATHAWLCDNAAASTGNVLFHGALAASKDADIDDTIVFAIGEIDVSLN